MSKVIDQFVGEYYFLSNMFPCKIEYKGLVFDCAEAAFQAQKKPEQAQMFIGLNGYQARKLGRRIPMTKEELDSWNSIRKFRTMYEVVWHKFHQNKDLLEKLNATEDAILIERNTWGDTLWGVCNGKGKNFLGYYLALARKATVFYADINEDTQEQYVYTNECRSGADAIKEIAFAENTVGIPAYVVINGHLRKNGLC